LRLDVCHLANNATIAPSATLAALILGDGGDEDLEIHPLGTLRVPPLTKSGSTGTHAPAAAGAPRRWLIPAAVAAALILVIVSASLLESVPVDVHPSDARVLTPGTLLSIHSGNSLLLLPGKHVVRAERNGYVAAQTDLVVRSNDANGVHLRLEKLPGKLHIDTDGIAATVSVDGVEVGRAPGVMNIPAGERTVMIRSPRHVDYITSVVIDGAGERQDLKAVLQPSWGALKVLSIPDGAHVSVDGAEWGIAPVTVAAPSGVRRIQISAPGWKTWESSVVLKAGETLDVGPVTLGQPDAHLTLRSNPSGADATVAGTHLGRTPTEIDLPAGIAHQVVLSAPGYKNWTKAVFAEPGRNLALVARLEPVLARVNVQGDPADAELVIDGVLRGQAPQSFSLSATEHRIEVRKEGFVPFKGTVTPAAGLDRTVQYQLRRVTQ
jgi:PEGA domain